jgi:hypothetical protein
VFVRIASSSSNRTFDTASEVIDGGRQSVGCSLGRVAVMGRPDHLVSGHGDLVLTGCVTVDALFRRVLVPGGGDSLAGYIEPTPSASSGRPS